jgi:very-short-patch-repair endonuclease/predicted transcriptional regulator of viral defense system
VATYLSYMGRKVAKPDVCVAEIAEKQWGVVSVDQLRRLGLNEKAIRRRADSARLHRVHRGVYAVGHPGLSIEGRWLAAVLAVGGGPQVGSGSVLGRWGVAVSHRSAASLWQMLPVRPGPSEVIVGGNGGRAKRRGIRVHRSLSLGSADVTLRNGIPVTTPRRTIADLRQAVSVRALGAVSARELRKAIRQANVIGLPIDYEAAADRTRSDLEADFLSICRRHRLPRPEVNVRIGPFLVDFLWQEERLVVETDGYRYHRGKAAFQEDRSRELELMRLGYSVLRLSEAQIDEAPKDLGEVLGAELRKRRKTPNADADAVSLER